LNGFVHVDVKVEDSPGDLVDAGELRDRVLHACLGGRNQSSRTDKGKCKCGWQATKGRNHFELNSPTGSFASPSKRRMWQKQSVRRPGVVVAGHPRTIFTGHDRALRTIGVGRSGHVGTVRLLPLARLIGFLRWRYIHLVM